MMRGGRILVVAVVLVGTLGLLTTSGGGLRALLPPLVAIALALLTGKSLLALGAGLAAACWLLASGRPLDSVEIAFRILGGALVSSFSLSILAFVLGLIGMIAIATRCGGTRGLVELVASRVRTARSVQLATALAGLAVFFDDYSNCVVVGTSMRPLSDRARVSREKLAYLVDSTAASLASMTLLSTWAWFEIGLLQEPLLAVGAVAEKSEVYRMFWRLVPLRFYCLATLVLLFLSVLQRRDLSTMARAEKRARQTGQVASPASRPLSTRGLLEVTEKDGVPARWYNAAVPLGTVILLLLLGFFLPGISLERSTVVALAAVAGSLVACLLACGQRLLTPGEAVRAWLSGARTMVLALTVLVLAWAISDALRELGTADTCVAWLEGRSLGVVLPLAIFLLAAFVSFATGSSWSTMGLLLPTVIPVAWEVGPTTPAGNLGLTLLAASAVLDGSIFGDHCSPLSDTTILSSAACSCNHVDHVRTQLPYALLSMIMAAGMGYLPCALGWSPWLFVPMAALALFAVLRVIGVRVP